MTLDWESDAKLPIWRAFGEEDGYAITDGPSGETRLSRWSFANADDPMLFAGEVTANLIQVADVDMGKMVAQAYEDGRSIHGQPAWQHIGSRKRDFYDRQAPGPDEGGPS